MKKTTIEEISARTELSTSTVSLALRDSPRVKEDTKRLVRSIAKELNYKRNLLGRAFNLQKTDTIGAFHLCDNKQGFTLHSKFTYCCGQER